MCKTDLHVHSTFSDGNDSIEEIILQAIDMGMTKVGISDHSYTYFDESYCIKKSDIPIYIKEVLSLKKKYKDKIEIALGIEQDYYSDSDTTGCDYVIGSVHYLKVNDYYIPVDESPEILVDASKKYFNGDIYSLIDSYYITLADVIEKTGADIIGHFDLISKFNEKQKLFNETDERYIKAFKYAADKLLKTGKLFEINTGAISRGYKSNPYPSNIIYEYLKANGARFILSSDSHNKETLCYRFNEYKSLI